MKRLIGGLCAMLATCMSLTSCLSNDSEEATYYADVAITGVTLGTLNRYTSTTSTKTGNDTIVKSTLTGANYKMTIDQLEHRIFNRDSLPVGTDAKHVTLSSITTKHNGVVFVKSLTSDSLFYLNTTDSVDFSVPRTLRVFSSDGQNYRDYTMALGVSQTTGVNFGWKLVAQSEQLAGWTDKHLVACLDTVLLVNRGTIVTGSSIYDVQAMRVGKDGFVEHCYMGKDGKDGYYFMGDIDQIEVWEDYHAAEESPDLTTLIGATEHEIFALGKDGRLKVCTDGTGFRWRDEQLDEDAALLPQTGLTLTSWAYAPADSMDYVLLAGNSEADGDHAVVWRKLSRYHAEGQATEGQWVYMPIDSSNRYALPRQEGLSIAYYEGAAFAIGSDMTLLQSRDQGITWKKNSTYALPDNIEGTSAVIATDSKGCLWIATNAGQLWQGTLR